MAPAATTFATVDPLVAPRAPKVRDDVAHRRSNRRVLDTRRDTLLANVWGAEPDTVDPRRGRIVVDNVPGDCGVADSAPLKAQQATRSMPGECVADPVHRLFVELTAGTIGDQESIADQAVRR